jgi:tetratricopeptide (TPR) repeat protein/DNA-binding CsgD family transcriptional regulator
MAILLVSAFGLHAQNTAKIDSLERVLSQTDDPSDKISTLLSLGYLLINIDIAKSLEYSMEAYLSAEKLSDKESMMRASLQIAKIHFFTSDLSLAMEYAQKVKALAEDLGDDHYLAVSMDAIGSIYYDIGNQARSSENFFASLKIYESLQDKDGIGSTYCRIGTLYLDQQDYEKAAEYYTSSIRIAREINSLEGIASNLNNLAKVYYNQGEYDKALSTYEEALKINIESNNSYLIGLNYLNIADVYRKMGDYRTAISNLEKSREIFEKIGNRLRLAKNMVMLSEIYRETEQAELSEKTAKEALAIALSQDYREVIVDAASGLYQLNMMKKDSAAALKYFSLEQQYQDSLFLEEKQKKLTALELQHQFEKSEQLRKIERQRRTIAGGIIAGILFFSLIIMFLVIKQLRLRAKKLQLEKAGFERELEFRNKELVLNVMSLMQKNELLADLSEKLIKIDESSTTPESKDTIKKVARELQNSQEKEIWKEFSHRFKEVHGEFYEKLLLKYPTLTPNELKLCAFLRLNLSSKDIAELTGQRVSTLETARYRLRQKLGIANSDINLVTFLSSI